LSTFSAAGNALARAPLALSGKPLGKPPSPIGNHAAGAGKTTCPACPAGMFHVKHWNPGLNSRESWPVPTKLTFA